MFSALVFIPLGLPAATAVPSHELIEKHLDRTVEIYGSYSAVRLPLTNGVPIWNPTTIRVSPQGEIFVANYVAGVGYALCAGAMALGILTLITLSVPWAFILWNRTEGSKDAG